jgi:hypothetical protein
MPRSWADPRENSDYVQVFDVPGLQPLIDFGTLT